MDYGNSYGSQLNSILVTDATIAHAGNYVGSRGEFCSWKAEGNQGWAVLANHPPRRPSLALPIVRYLGLRPCCDPEGSAGRRVR